MSPYHARLKLLSAQKKLPKGDNLSHKQLLAYCEFTHDMLEFANKLYDQGDKKAAQDLMADVVNIIEPYEGQVQAVLAHVVSPNRSVH